MFERRNCRRAFSGKGVGLEKLFDGLRMQTLLLISPAEARVSDSKVRIKLKRLAVLFDGLVLSTGEVIAVAQPSVDDE